MNYAVLDIESTGGKFNEEGIMEVAIYRFNGVEITDSFSALINPERPIQSFVSQLTGIREPMLKAAPKFHEVARRIVEITEGTVLVAHNASFDYRILRTEFERLGFDFKRPTLCTVALSQLLIPEAESHSLGKLARSLGIPVSDRHRAQGDALATLKLLKILLLKEGSSAAINELIRDEEYGELSDNQLKMVRSVPEETGVYSLYDKQGSLLYVSASTNMKQSVNQHFTARDKTNRALQKYTRKVEHEISGTLLLAELQARSEARNSKPKYIRKNKENSVHFKTLHRINDPEGYLGFLIGDREDWEDAELIFPNFSKMETFLLERCREFELCTYTCGLHRKQEGCPLHPGLGSHDEILMEEAPEDYNPRFLKLVERYSIQGKTMLLQDKGRVDGERGFIYIREGRITGMGYTELNLQINSLDRIEKVMRPLHHTLYNRLLVESGLREKKSLKTVYIRE